MRPAAVQRSRTRDSRRDARLALAYRPVPSGVVEVEHANDEWWLVAIGRGRTVKRFKITRGEAAELVRVLRAKVLTLDGDES